MYDSPENQQFDPTPPPAPKTPPRPRSVSVPLPIYRVRLTYVLMVINTAIFAGLMLWSFWDNIWYAALLSFGWKENILIANGEYWRLFTAMFLHGSYAHIGANMLSLYVLGRVIESRFGTLRFALVYFIGGLLGSVASFWLTDAPSVGASGAIFALIGALAAFYLKNRKLLGDRAYDSLQSIAVIIMIQLAMGSGSQIDNWAHLGGLLGGLLMAWLIGPFYSLKKGATPETLVLSDKTKNAVTIMLGSFVGLAITAALTLYGATQYPQLGG